jgi:hypothetical protein
MAIARVTLDASGNLYQTIQRGAAFNWGEVIKLTHSGSNWIYTDLNDFTQGSDGGGALGGVAFDSAGNLYGTTQVGGGSGCGGFGCGIVWEITPWRALRTG